MIELEFLSGRDKGKSIRPSSERITIGRAPDNTVVLQNPQVSSHHGIIVKRGATYIYEDLGSTNGTLVRRRGREIYLGNDTQRELPLLGGDEIRLGAIPEVVKLKVRMRPGDDALGNGSSTIVATCSMDDLTRIDESLEKNHEILLALYRYTKEIQGLNSSREIHEALCHSVFQIFPQASHLSVVLWDEKKGDYEPIVHKVRRKGSHSEAFQLSRSLIQRVIERKEAVLFEDARQALGGAESVISGKILSSICVPLTNQEGLRGMLQVDNRPQTTALRATDEGIVQPTIDHSFPTRYRDAYRAELACFLECVRGEREVPITHADVRRSHAVADAAERSWREGQPVSLTSPGSR
jgi:GAF domain-containing protein